MKKLTPRKAWPIQFKNIPKQTKITVLQQILKDLHSTRDLSQLLKNVERIVKDEFACKAVLISILDSYREELVYHSTTPQHEETEFRLKLGEGLAGTVGASRAPRRVDDFRSFPASEPIYKAFGIKAAKVLTCPIVRRGALLGVIEVFFAADSRTPQDDDLVYLTVLTHQIAIGLNSFKLTEQAKRVRLEEEKLAQVSQRISASLDLDELLDLIIEALRALVPYDAAGIYLLDRNSQEIQRMVVYGYAMNVDQASILNVGRGASQLVRESNNALILRDLSHYPVRVNARSSARSVMIAPILSNNRTIGVFTLESDEPDVYTRNDLALFQKFAHQAALSLEKAQLHRALLDKKKLEQELSIAREIQLSFLPSTEPPIAGFEVAGLNLPSRLVSGDHYDFIKIVEGQWGLVIGDVSGKGIPASLIMASFRASLLAEIRNNYSISTIMAKVNRLLWESTDANQFVTAFYGVLDEKRKVLTYCNAGHNPPLLVRNDGSWLKLETGGLVLGAFDDSVYQESLMEMRSHDLLLLYTDGVTEIYNEEGEEFGVERLLGLVRVHPELSARQITDMAQEHILDFAADRTIQDDFTLVVVKAE